MFYFNHHSQFTTFFSTSAIENVVKNEDAKKNNAWHLRTAREGFLKGNKILSSPVTAQELNCIWLQEKRSHKSSIRNRGQLRDT